MAEHLDNPGYTWTAEMEATWQESQAQESREVSDAEYEQALAATDAQRYGQPAEDPAGFDYEGEPEE